MSQRPSSFCHFVTSTIVAVHRVYARFNQHKQREIVMTKRWMATTAAIALMLPAAANAQMFTPGPANPGFYVGAEGGLNWILQNNTNSYNTGYAVGGKVGYDFVGPRVELEGLYRNNQGSGIVPFANGSA